MQTTLRFVENVAHVNLTGGNGAIVGAKRLVQLQCARILHNIRNELVD